MEPYHTIAKEASINPADVLHLQLYLCDSDITSLYVKYVHKVLRSMYSIPFVLFHLGESETL